MNPELILLIQAGASCGMMGLIWFVQIVHYPAYRYVGKAEFRRYQTHHQRATSWIVGPLMAAEMGMASLLVLQPVPGIGQVWAVIGLALVGALWTSTVLWQVPLHTRLLMSGQEEYAERLIRSNWLRTILWTLRAVLSLAMLSWLD